MTNLNHVAMRCKENKNHPMFRGTDGARCIECKSLLDIIPVSRFEYYQLPTYEQLRIECKQKPKVNNRDEFYAVVEYVKCLETLLLHNGIPLPSSNECIDVPNRLEGSE